MGTANDEDRKLARNFVENYCQHTEPVFHLDEAGNCSGCGPRIDELEKDIASYREQIVRESEIAGIKFGLEHAGDECRERIRALRGTEVKEIVNCDHQLTESEESYYQRHPEMDHLCGKCVKGDRAR